MVIYGQPIVSLGLRSWCNDWMGNSALNIPRGIGAGAFLVGELAGLPIDFALSYIADVNGNCWSCYATWAASFLAKVWVAAKIMEGMYPGSFKRIDGQEILAARLYTGACASTATGLFCVIFPSLC